MSARSTWSVVVAMSALCSTFGAPARAQEKERDGAKQQAVEVSLVPVSPELARGLANSDPSLREGPPPRPYLSQSLVDEVEPNDTSGTANPIAGTNAVLIGYVFPGADVDFFSFTATAGDRVYAATMTSFSPASTDTVLALLDTNGSTVLEEDDQDGVFGGNASSLAGVTIPTTGTYFLRVTGFLATTQVRPYHLHVQVRSGAPTPETEPNDALPGQALPVSGWVSGDTSAATDLDFFTISLNAGDTVYLSLDLDPERDAVSWDGNLGLGLFPGDATNQLILVGNDAGAFDTIDSEAFFMTVRDAGTYSIRVAAAAATFGTYHLSVSVHPSTPDCTTYTSTNVPQTIGPLTGTVTTSTVTVPGPLRVGTLQVLVDADMALTTGIMADLDTFLTSPAGNSVGLFTDIGSLGAGATVPTSLNLVLDDHAAIPPSFTVLDGMRHTPESAYRLGWFNGVDAAGTWTLTITDDANDTSGGTLNNWSLRICDAAPPPVCVGTPVTVYSRDFEANDGGFTHSGTLDEWERGLPSGTVINTCHSGVNCWKTDLDATYENLSNQDLLSPPINLAGASGPITVQWAMKYQMESATFDHAFVEVREVGNPANARRLFEWRDATMTTTIGATTLQESAGWSLNRADISSFAGLTVELRFHVDTDNSVQLSGLAIDDVTVTACVAGGGLADLSITKTDGVANAVPGGSVTYTIVASNAGPDHVVGATVADFFPAACTSVNWTCVGAGGGTCTASGSGNISDIVGLPVGGSVTYAATCTISPSASGTLVNTAAVASVVVDPNPANNSATDTDTLTPEADLRITKTDGQTTVYPGQTITYTIVASNAGPSAVTAATVTDVVPAALLGATWTCVGAGGGTCTAAGAGNINDVVNLPVGATVTYTLTGTVDPTATGSLSNTASIAPPVGTTDPVPGNNSATDTDTLIACGDEIVMVPDGRLGGLTLPAGAIGWFGASLKIGSAYSVEFKNQTGTVPPGVLTVFSGDDGCSGTSTVVATDTSMNDPSGTGGLARASFTAAGTMTFFRARLVNSTGGPVEIGFGWSDLTLFSPAWTTNGSFDTFYSFQNTTGATVMGTLTLLDTAGAVVSTFPVTIPAGQTTSTNTSSLGVPRNRVGTAKFTHNGPPGAVVAETAIANFNLNPAYVQPVKFQPVREAR